MSPGDFVALAVVLFVIGAVGVLCGGFAAEDIRAAGAHRIHRDPADLLAHLDDWLD